MLPGNDHVMFCQNCGAEWERSFSVSMERFLPRPAEPKWTSPAALTAADVEMEECPKCPIPDLDAVMNQPEKRRAAGDETDPRRVEKPADGFTIVETNSDQA